MVMDMLMRNFGFPRPVADWQRRQEGIARLVSPEPLKRNHIEH